MEEILNAPWFLLLCAMGVPSLLTAWLGRRIEKREKDHEACDERREKLLLQTIRSTNAAIALGEATARAVQRIPDAHCNGDMHAALDYAETVKHQQKDFLAELGVHSLMD